MTGGILHVKPLIEGPIGNTRISNRSRHDFCGGALWPFGIPTSHTDFTFRCTTREVNLGRGESWQGKERWRKGEGVEVEGGCAVKVWDNSRYKMVRRVVLCARPPFMEVSQQASQ